MRYQSTTGLHRDDIIELCSRIHDVLAGRGIDLKGHRMGLYRQVEITLVLLGQNMSQTVVADMFGISQPSVSRIYRRILGILEVVTMFTGISLEQSLTQGHLVLVDGTYIPTGNRPATGQDKANYSGKHHLQCLSVQVACTSRGDLIAVWRPGPRGPTRQCSPRAVSMGRGLGQLSGAVGRRHRLHRNQCDHPDQETCRHRPQGLGKGVQQAGRKPARTHRARHRTAEELEDPRQMLPPTPRRAPTRHHSRHPS